MSNPSSRYTLWAFLVVVICLLINKLTIDKKDDVLQSWLVKNKLIYLKYTLQNHGIYSIEQLLSIDLDKFVQSSELNARQTTVFTKKFIHLKEADNKLTKWLQRNNLLQYQKGFHKLGYINLDIVKQKLDVNEIRNLIEDINGDLADYEQLTKAVEKLRENSNGLVIVQIFFFILRSIWFLFKWIFQLLLFGSTCYFIKHKIVNHYNIMRARQPRNISFFQYLWGNYLNSSSCHVGFLWQDKIQVGTTVKFILKLFKRNPFLSYEISGGENILIEVRCNGVTEEIIKERDLTVGRNALCVTFHPKKAGKYEISILVNGKNINGSPFSKTFLPGPVDLSNITILNGINMLVLTRSLYYPLKVETRDKYNNLCEMKDKKLIKVHVKQIGSNTKTIDPELVILPDEGGRNCLYIKVEEQGCFHAYVTYQDQSITNGTFVIISLNGSDTELLKKATMKNSWHQTWYEAFLLESENSTSDQPLQAMDMTTSNKSSSCQKSRKVYCYFSSRQLTVKEFYLKIIPYRLYSFRISPSTKIVFPERDNSTHPQFILDDGIQPPVMFMSPKRSLIVATFARFLLRNIGGAESFKDKKQFFYKALQSHHGRDKLVLPYNNKVGIRVDRKDILKSSYDATRNLSTSKWCKQFSVKFDGEEGYDAGGLTREWISVLSIALFDPKNKLFTQFNKDNKQALICPNPSRPDHLKLKYYEFAGRIVGKCIFESSCDAFRSLNAKARFARSFLAQLIGLRVNYKYFETDDKQLYSSKIKYIQDVDPEDLNLYFSEEVYDINGCLVQEVELVQDGCKIPVTEQNKMKYLDALAQYRLHTRVSDEIEAFLKGLNEIVPDNLLTMFSEQELELLICGTSDISVNDLNKHHKLFSYSPSFTKIMTWFWKSIALFNQEELARLLQFTTGSSQLPHGGFAQLTPSFSFMQSPLENVLPKAHTCFNQLVFPDYTSYEEFDRCLHLAITEGYEGFAFG